MNKYNVIFKRGIMLSTHYRPSTDKFPPVFDIFLEKTQSAFSNYNNNKPVVLFEKDSNGLQELNSVMTSSDVIESNKNRLFELKEESGGKGLMGALAAKHNLGMDSTKFLYKNVEEDDEIDEDEEEFDSDDDE